MRIFSNPATPLHSKRTRLSPLNKIPAKVVHTTCLLLQNKISYSISGCGAVGSAGGLGAECRKFVDFVFEASKPLILLGF